MINCVIYEDNEKMQNIYKQTVNNFFKSKNQKVIFHTYNIYSNNLQKDILNINGNKIYILDIEVPGRSGLDLARDIRNSGDWDSPLIIITSYDCLKNTSFTSKMLMLDFISKKEDINIRLLEALKITDNIINIDNSYNFQYNGKFYHIKHSDILYFEKGLNDNYTFLYTKKIKHKIKESITQIEKVLKNNKQFYKIQRSCIVNVDNINYFDLNKNILYFGDHKLNLISKESKNNLVNILESYRIEK